MALDSQFLLFLHSFWISYHLPYLGFNMWLLKCSMKISITQTSDAKINETARDRTGQVRTRQKWCKQKSMNIIDSREGLWPNKCTKVRPYTLTIDTQTAKKMARHLICFGLFFGRQRKKNPTRKDSICPKVQKGHSAQNLRKDQFFHWKSLEVPSTETVRTVPVEKDFVECLRELIIWVANRRLT